MDYTAIAGLMFASSFLSSIIQPLFGYLADKGSRQWFMAVGVFFAGTSLAITGFVSDYWLIFAAVTVMGIATSIFHPEAATAASASARCSPSSSSRRSACKASPSTALPLPV